MRLYKSGGPKNEIWMSKSIIDYDLKLLGGCTFMSYEDESLRDFVFGLDKAELHIHIEGSLEPELMLELANNNGVQLPFNSVRAIRAAYDFSNLQDFLDLYYAGLDVLQKEQDFYKLACAYLQRMRDENVSSVEVFFDPQAHTKRGVPLQTLMNGLLRAVGEFESEVFSVSLILCFLRHLSVAEAFDTLESVEPFRDSILGVGLDSSELGNPPSKFKHVFDVARNQGYKLVAHAGEEGPPEYVWEALDDLGVDRIDHGNRALEDDSLVRRLRDDQIPLTVCPLSNVKLCVVDELFKHPLKRMLDLGLLATVNSDDPAYFGGYLCDNYVSVGTALDLSRDELHSLSQNSLRAKFV